MLDSHPSVVEVVELLTMALAPNALLVAARVDVEDGLTGAEVERTSSQLDDELRERVPDVTEVFIDPTPAGADLRRRPPRRCGARRRP